MENISSAYYKSFANYKQIQFHQSPEIAFVGRSNVGKSSLINALCSNKHLAKTSQQPGKTQLLNFFNSSFKVNNKIWNFFIVDLPGYGYAKLAKTQIVQMHLMVEDYLIYSPQLKHLFLLIDARHDLSVSDQEFLYFLNSHNKKYSIIFTKTDKLKPLEKDRQLHKLQQDMLLKSHIQLEFFESGFNIPSSINLLRKFILNIVLNSPKN